MAENANMARALLYWRALHVTIEFCNPIEKVNKDLIMARASQFGILRRISNTACGRVQKRAALVYKLYVNLFDECDRLQKCGVKFNASLLLLVTREPIKGSTKGSFVSAVRDSNSKVYCR